jgi:hypothetical protein
MQNNVGRALALILILILGAASPAFASQFPTGSRYLQISGSRSAPASSAAERKGKRESKSESKQREGEVSRPAWHEILSRLF